MPVRTYLNMVDACLKPRSFMSDILNTEGEEGWKEGRAVIKSFSCELEGETYRHIRANTGPNPPKKPCVVKKQVEVLIFAGRVTPALELREETCESGDAAWSVLQDDLECGHPSVGCQTSLQTPSQGGRVYVPTTQHHHHTAVVDVEMPRVPCNPILHRTW